MSLCLFSTEYHDLTYELGWRTLKDPSQVMSYGSIIRRQLLGHGLVSSFKYTFKIDSRDSPIRPTQGYAFLSRTQFGGLTPDPLSLPFLRHEFDLRHALPLGFYNTALNLGISGGVVFPWRCGSLNKPPPSPLPERFFMAGDFDFSPVCSIGGLTKSWGFKTPRGFSPNEPERRNTDGVTDDDDGDVAVTAFADLSFDLPIEWLRERGIHGHVFAGVGNVAKLTDNEYRRRFSSGKFLESFRSSVGCGIVVPASLFRLEGNLYYTLRQHEHDRAQTGFRFSFSAPS